MGRRFHVPGCFHPAYSLLGRLVRRRVRDERRARSLYIVVLAVLGLSLLLAQFATWPVVEAIAQEELRQSATQAYWLVQIASTVLFGALGLLGFKPPIIVRCTARHLHVRQGSRFLTLRRDDLRRVEPISALLYHRHYSRYAAVRSFVNDPKSAPLLLHTARGLVVLGLRPGDQETLTRMLQAKERLALT